MGSEIVHCSERDEDACPRAGLDVQKKDLGSFTNGTSEEKDPDQPSVQSCNIVTGDRLSLCWKDRCVVDGR